MRDRHYQETMRRFEILRHHQEAVKCYVPDCDKPRHRGVGRFCNRHVIQRNQHGSAFRKRYTGKELRNYRRRAERYLERHRDDQWCRAVLLKIEGLLTRSQGGRLLDWKTYKPPRKAEVVQARILSNPTYRKWTPYEAVLVAWLTVALKVHEETDHPLNLKDREYWEQTQIGYLVANVATLSEVRENWPIFYVDEATGLQCTKRVRMVFQARRQGGWLRHLGRNVEECCEFLRDHAVDPRGAKLFR